MMAGCELKGESSAADGKFLHARGRGGAVFFQQSGELFQVQHVGANRKSLFANRKWKVVGKPGRGRGRN